ncbi:MAG: class I SAM-dependent methyltransferase [Saprospiraceae bacterium]
MHKKYDHSTSLHNTIAPREIVPKLMELFHPTSVLDVGCGLGTFLYCFKELGVSRVLGLDGEWVDKELMNPYLAPEEFKTVDLEQRFGLSEQFDLVLCLEVAEHLSPTAADRLVQSLTQAGNLVVFSAAIPLQGGDNHLNEQWLSYWEEKFAKFDYQLHDILRPLFWHNEKIFWWYKQNIVLFASKAYSPPSHLVNNQLENLVHPELFLFKSETLNRTLQGKIGIFKAVRILLCAIRNKLPL